jgi:hypothetical protein
VEGHAAVPDLKDLERVGEVVVRLVEEHVAEPSAEHDAERRPGQKIIDVGRLCDQRRPFGERDAIAPADDQPGDIGERVPAYREGAELDEGGVDDRVGNGKEHWTVSDKDRVRRGNS